MASKSELDLLVWAGKKGIERVKQFLEDLDSKPVSEPVVATGKGHSCTCNHHGETTVKPVSKLDVLTALSKWFEEQRDGDDGPLKIQSTKWHTKLGSNQASDLITIVIDDKAYDVLVKEVA